MVTLQGRGGIGKTSLALRVIDEACSEEMFDLILWFSARDIDLHDTGAVLVQPDVVTLDDLAANASQLLADVGTSVGAKPSASDWLAQILADEGSGSILWVLDNFETLNNPLEVFAHFDAYIRSPHKVLITTRHREFRGDYPITVSGMRQNEFEKLVGQESIRLGLSLPADDVQMLFVESRGHPYVAKIMLGEMKVRPGSKPRHVLEKRDDVLDALFERTFARLSNDARHAFLLLSTWRSLVPVLALDVVMNGQRPGEAVDTEEAVDELEALSLVQVVRSEANLGSTFRCQPGYSVAGSSSLIRRGLISSRRPNSSSSLALRRRLTCSTGCCVPRRGFGARFADTSVMTVG